MTGTMYGNCSGLTVFLLFLSTFWGGLLGEEEDVKVVDLAGDLTLTLTFKRISPQSYGIAYPDFFILDTEVTNRHFKAYLDARELSKDDTDVLNVLKERERTGGMSTGDVPYRIEDESTIWRDGSYPEGLDEHPVALVTLHDATDFAEWISENDGVGVFRLPTWNEWMVAAYGKARRYPWGDDWDATRLHSSYGFRYQLSSEENLKENVPPRRTEPVRVRESGKSLEGVYGLLGNVSEYIVIGDPAGKDYFNLGSRSMGGGFTDGLTLFDEEVKILPPRKDYWGYSHHAIQRRCDLGFRLVFVAENNGEMIAHPRLFEQRNKAWMTERDKVSR